MKYKQIRKNTYVTFKYQGARYTRLYLGRKPTNRGWFYMFHVPGQAGIIWYVLTEEVHVMLYKSYGRRPRAL